MRKNELLVPASSLEVLKIAVIYGADAVYIGGEAFGLRAKAKNFTKEEMAEGIAFAHARGVKVYVTANILAHNYDLEGARAYFEELKTIGPDALIISDPGMFTIAKEVMPDTDIHISTQANNTNYMTYQFWWKQGAKRVVTARELSLNEIKGIRAHIPDDMEIETFIHGAMCISYSGRCLLSSFMAGRDANRGACTHPCRWKYSVVEESRPGEYMPVYENERGTYIFNSKDLCMIEHVPEMIDAGIDSFKIEGRMKTALYVATVARTYRKAIDDYLENPEKYKANMEWYKEEIGKCTYREFTTGFYFGKPTSETQIYDEDVEFTIGKAHQIQDGKDVVIIANGDTVRLAIEAAKVLEGKGISARVLDMHTIKPLDVEAVTAAINEVGKIITVEDHNILNGLGSAVCEVAAEMGKGIVKRVGIQDQFGQSAPYERLLAMNGVTVENITEIAETLVKG